MDYTKSSSRSVGIVVDALKQLKESDGSKGKDICKFIASTYNSDFDNIRNKVRRALKRAITMGLVRKTSTGLYMLIKPPETIPIGKKVCWYPGYRKGKTGVGRSRARGTRRRRSQSKKSRKGKKSKRRSKKIRRRPLLPKYSANRFSITSLNGDAEMIVKELVHNIRLVQRGLAPKPGVVIKEITEDKKNDENHTQQQSKTNFTSANNSQITAFMSKSNSRESKPGVVTSNTQTTDPGN